MTEFSYSMDDLISLFKNDELSWEEFRFFGDYVEVHKRIDQMIVDLVVKGEMSVREVEQIMSAPIVISVDDGKE